MNYLKALPLAYPARSLNFLSRAAFSVNKPQIATQEFYESEPYFADHRLKEVKEIRKGVNLSKITGDRSIRQTYYREQRYRAPHLFHVYDLTKKNDVEMELAFREEAYLSVVSGAYDELFNLMETDYADNFDNFVSLLNDQYYKRPSKDNFNDAELKVLRTLFDRIKLKQLDSLTPEIPKIASQLKEIKEGKYKTDA